MKRKRVPMRYIPIFCKEMHRLVRAGVPIADGLALLRDDESDPAVKAALSAMHTSCEDGEQLSGGVLAAGVFPDDVPGMVAAAERVGNLEKALPALARDYERRLRMREELRGAVTGPVALLFAMAAMALLLAIEVLPAFDRVLGQLGASMGPAARAMMSAGAAIARSGGVIIAVGGVLLAGALAFSMMEPLNKSAASFLRQIFGKQSSAARFASALAMCVSAGLDIDESAGLAFTACGGEDPRADKFWKAVLDGSGVADAFESSGLFGTKDCRLVRLAERTGGLDEALEDLAAEQEEAARRRMEKITGAIEPAIVVLASLLAAAVLLSVMLPMAGMLSM